ncbi:hypothetical protein F0562_027408 [Nyssa sinensis]|uniref:IST1-like protein n=1 Tax=Nyssa sinensis TaxID=561372 RepID=A0A5J5B804_9ASTE|nr:hypothetical protein F0562_027408 [Nyssa sinensis]
MSMFDSFANKGFKAAKCKTLLKLTIPRIKLLRNRREIQIKKMRRDIAKLLETGQEATACIRVEHIIREEKMMSAQEIIELFCELITVRLPLIEAQRECPLDLKEAISSACFAAPRCADLPELLQVPMLFTAKYGKEFVTAATELMPECGVNHQLVEMLSVRGPAPDVKLKLLKAIAEEHELDWDPAASEIELLKPHEDLLNGPTQFVSGSKVPLPEEKLDGSLYSASEQGPHLSDSDTGFDPTDFPKVPRAVWPSARTISPIEMLPFPGSLLPEFNHESAKESDTNEDLPHEPYLEREEVLEEKSVTNKSEVSNISVGLMEDKQFVPFISPPSSSASFYLKQSDPPPSLSRTKSEVNVVLQDVLAAAQAAAETAELAAAAARSAANLAQVRISELVKKQNDEATDRGSENPFHANTRQSSMTDKPHLDHQNSNDSDAVLHSPIVHEEPENYLGRQASDLPSYDDPKVKFDSSLSSDNALGHNSAYRHPQRLTSMDDETNFSYPNLFRSEDSFTNNSRSTHEL